MVTKLKTRSFQLADPSQLVRKSPLSIQTLIKMYHRTKPKIRSTSRFTSQAHVFRPAKHNHNSNANNY